MTTDEAAVVFRNWLECNRNNLNQRRREAFEIVLEAAIFMSESGPEDSEAFMVRALKGVYDGERSN